MHLWQALAFGVVEGITEFLPVSSTGHLILTARLMGLAQTEFLKSFEIAIQSGAILAVIALYGRTLLRERELLKRVIAAFIPTALVGWALYKLIKGFLLGRPGVVVGALLIGGIFIVVFEKFYQKKSAHRPVTTGVTYRQAVLIGLCQSLAMVPGVSRSAATILGGLTLGLDRKTIVEFSFLLAVPTMLAATAYDLLKSMPSFSSEEFVFLSAGFLVSFAVAVASIKFFLFFIQRYSFEAFGVYRIILALSFLVFFM